jgi:hypothetical protein
MIVVEVAVAWLAIAIVVGLLFGQIAGHRQ